MMPFVANSFLLSRAKLVYYTFFSWMYGFVGSCANLAMALPLEREPTPPKIISVAQFQPEKAHTLQLQAFTLSTMNLDLDVPRPKLQFVGSCRNDADEKRLQNLKDLAIELKVDDDESSIRM